MALFSVICVVFGAAMIYIIYSLFRQLVLRGLVRYQIRFFIGGIFASFRLQSFFPMLGIRRLIRPIGPVFTLIMVASISYAIVKFRLMDIRPRKVVSYVLALPLQGQSSGYLLYRINTAFTLKPTSFLLH